MHNADMICGYARASTDGQSVDARVGQRTPTGRAQVFCEKATGAKTEAKTDPSRLHRAPG
jgi:hypothetical protein